MWCVYLDNGNGNLHLNFNIQVHIVVDLIDNFGHGRGETANVN